MSFSGFAIGWTYSNLRLHGGTKKSSACLSSCRRVVVSEMMERCAPGGSRAGGGGCTSKAGTEKTPSVEAPESLKKRAETLKYWGRGEKVSDGEVKVAPAINVQCYTSTALSAGSPWCTRRWMVGGCRGQGANTPEAGGERRGSPCRGSRTPGMGSGRSGGGSRGSRDAIGDRSSAPTEPSDVVSARLTGTSVKLKLY